RCTKDAGCFRAATPQLGTPRPDSGSFDVLVYRPDRTENAAEAPREPDTPEEDRPRADGAQEEAIQCRAAAFGTEDIFRWPHHFCPDRRAKDGSSDRADALQLRYLRIGRHHILRS